MASTLDTDLIYRSLNAGSRAALDSFDVFEVLPSTNTWLMQQERHDPGRFRAVLAEHQTAGRGRQGKHWISPPNAGICLSLAYTFKQSPNNLSCLTLAAGVGVAKALQAFGAENVKLKWPNDIYVGDAKLGGILTDAQTTAAGCITTICGVGINVDFGAVSNAGDLSNVDYPVTDLYSHIEKPIERSLIATAVIDQLIRVIGHFEAEGLEPFRVDWSDYDWLKGKLIEVIMPDSRVSGVAGGIDANGALRVTTGQGSRRVYTGSVTVLNSQSKSA